MNKSRFVLLVALLPATLAAQIIGGRVVDSATKHPLPDVKVTAIRVDSSVAVANATTDATGVFYIQIGRPGAYQLKFEVVPTILRLPDTLSVNAEGFVEREFILVLPSDPVFDSSQVDKRVQITPRSAAPRYPDRLRSAGVSGEVVLTFIVDKRGIVESTSINIVATTDSLFSASVIQALKGWTFNPAEFRGKPVRQFVQQPFEFSIDGGARRCGTVGGRAIAIASCSIAGEARRP